MEDNSAPVKDAQFFQHMLQSLFYHEQMLTDEVRNRHFYNALRKTVTNETRVLDIGAGSGVWAIAAAKLGAKSVTAIEMNTPMLPVIAAHAAENGVADRITIVSGMSTDIDLDGKFDLIVSETIGNQAYDENIIPTMTDARKRFLAPGGRIIPQKVALKATPVHVSGHQDIPISVPVRMDYLRNLLSNVTPKIPDRSNLEMLGPSKKVIEVDLRECEAETYLGGITTTWELANLRRANAIAIWSESELTDGLVLDAWETTSWMPVVCRFDPFDVDVGTLRFELNIDAQHYNWSVSANDIPARAYTPMFPYTRIKIDLSRLFPHTSERGTE
ncbi:MAG: 50S ribosomal protein L11 methyltransferase [Acidobacteriota bacterium]